MPLSMTIALTGSTSNFGTYILDLLLRSPNVAKVYCLNRSANARERQEEAQESRGLSTCFPKEQVEFFQVDFSAESWGIKKDTFDVFLREVDVIIHNAWVSLSLVLICILALRLTFIQPVDFNRNFISFEPHINGVRNLINIVRHRQKLYPSDPPSKDPMRILFISSMGTVSNWASQAPTSRALVPEAELTDWKLARTGYGQSKLLSERILAHAARCFGIPVTIARVGQMAGPVYRGEKGAWPDKEWLPSLIRSSVYLGAVPEDLGPMSRVDWVPVDVAAQVVMDLLTKRAEDMDGWAGESKRRGRNQEAEFFHIANPRAILWSEILPAVRRYLPSNIRTVRIEDWVDLLRKSAEAESAGIDEGVNPAAKLMDTFDHIQDRAIRFPKARAAILDTKNTIKASVSLADLHAIDEEWMELWMRQWAFSQGSYWR